MDKKADTKQTDTGHTFSDLTARTQKIVTAIYMISELIDEHDPLRKDIREMSVVLASLVGDMSIESGSRAKKTITEAQNYIDQIIDRLKVCVSVGLVSDMNFKIVSDYLVFVRDDLNKKYSVLNTHNGHGATFHNKAVQEFVLPKYLTDTQDVRSKETEVSKNQTDSFKKQTPNFVKDRQAPTVQKPQFVREEKKENNDRFERLIGLVGSKGEVSVGDLKNDFPELSEKTLQRMLVRLVETGKLTKTGEKRWSRYSLVS